MRSRPIASALVVLASLIVVGPAFGAEPMTCGIEGPPGAVTAVTVELSTNERIVADGFLDDVDLVEEERDALGTSGALPTSCAEVALARPFTRLRRLEASGKMLWEWRIDEDDQALRFLQMQRGDWLSPDRRHLAVSIYRNSLEDPGEAKVRLGNGIVSVGPSPAFEEAIGQATGQPFGHLRFSEPIGWSEGEPATFEFNVFPDGDQADMDTIVDKAVPQK